VVEWNTDDADGDEASHVVEYSADGVSWRTLTMDLPGNQLRISQLHLPGSSAAYVRVLATDGWNTAQQISPPFVVPTKAPELELEGVDTRYYRGGQMIQVRARATDQEDGVLSESSISWVSHIDGPIETGSLELVAGSLSVGIHHLSASARDSDGNVTTSTFDVEVLGGPSASFGAADLSINPMPEMILPAGSKTSVSIEVPNRGEGPATRFTLEIDLPTTLTTSGFNDVDWFCSRPNGGLTCEWVGSIIGPGETASLQFDLTAPNNVFVERLFNVAIAVHAEIDGDPSNNATFVNIEALAAEVPQLDTQVVTPDRVGPNQDAAFTVVVEHRAGGDASSVVVEGVLTQLGVGFTGAVGAGWACPQRIDAPHDIKCAFEGSAGQSGGTLPPLNLFVHNSNPDLYEIDFRYTTWSSEAVSAGQLQGEAPSDTGTPTDTPTGPGVQIGQVVATPVAVAPLLTGLNLTTKVGGPCAFYDFGTRYGDPCTEANVWHWNRNYHTDQQGYAALTPDGGSWDTQIQVFNTGTQAVSGRVTITIPEPEGASFRWYDANDPPSVLTSGWSCSGRTREFLTLLAAARKRGYLASGRGFLAAA
jgi:hypothetical protein